VEGKVDLSWRKSSYSGNGGSDCVEAGNARPGVAVRDTKDRTGPALAFSPESWRAFTRRVKDGAGPA
jgi:hypothetical protein